jgi:hypothetical protein
MWESGERTPTGTTVGATSRVLAAAGVEFLGTFGVALCMPDAAEPITGHQGNA